MKVPFVRPGLALLIFAATTSASAQTFPTNDPVIRNMWDQGMGSGSQVEHLAQVLTDSIGPRLIASPGYYAAIGVDGDRITILRGDTAAVKTGLGRTMIPACLHSPTLPRLPVLSPPFARTPKRSRSSGVASWESPTTTVSSSP